MTFYHDPTNENAPLLKEGKRTSEGVSVAQACAHARQQLNGTLHRISCGSELIERRKAEAQSRLRTAAIRAERLKHQTLSILRNNSELIERRKAEARSRHRTAAIRAERLKHQTLSILRSEQYASEQENKLKALYELAAVRGEEFRRAIHVSSRSTHYAEEQIAKLCPLYRTARICGEIHRHLNEAIIKGEQNANKQQKELSALLAKARINAEKLMCREHDVWPLVHLAAQRAHERECCAFAQNTSGVTREVEYSLLQSTSGEAGMWRWRDEYIPLNQQEERA